MKVLLTGAKGQLGWDLKQRALEQGFDINAANIEELDITQKEAVIKSVIQRDPSLVINAAAYTAVDRAESEPDLAMAVNRDGPSHLAGACAKAKIPLIHISTDYVFEGNKAEPYLESDPTAPQGVYGKSKEAGEKRIRDILPKHIIVRTAWLYGWHGPNFVKTMLGLGRKRSEIKVVNDQYGSPTFAQDLADAILVIATRIRARQRIAWGTYHFCGKGITSWYGFAKAIFDIAGQHESLAVKRIVPITTAQYPVPAKRPFNSALDCSLIMKTFGVKQPFWRQSLASMLSRLYVPS